MRVLHYSVFILYHNIILAATLLLPDCCIVHEQIFHTNTPNTLLNAQQLNLNDDNLDLYAWPCGLLNGTAYRYMQ